MGRKSGEMEQDPEFRRLDVEEREAEVATKKARAEVAKAEAEKKKKEAGVGEDSEISDKIFGGVVHDHYVYISRRPAGSGAYRFWKGSLPLDEIDSVEDYIQAEGDPAFDHIVIVKNANGKKIGKTVHFPAQDGATGSGAASVSALDRELKELDRKLEEKRKQKAAEKKRRKLEAEEEDEEDRDGGEDDHVFVPQLGGWFPRNHPMATGMGMPGMMPPWMQPQPQKDDTLKTLLPLLVAWISKPAEKNPLETLIPMLLSGANSGQLNPKDMISMFSPFVVEMGKASVESSNRMMEAMMKMDDTFRKKCLDLLMSDPSRSPDEIEKWQKWLNFGETALRKGAGVVRDALNGSPTDGKNPKRLEQRRPAPGLPGPKKGGEKQPDGGGDSAAPAAEQPQDPAAAAAQLKAKRVEAFLLAAEEEMLAESDPVLMAEKCEELYLTLPKSIRAKIEEAGGDQPPQDEKLLAVFMALKESAPEVTERIVTAIMADPDKQAWVKDFLVACAFPEEDEEPAGEEEEVPDAAETD